MSSMIEVLKEIFSEVLLCSSDEINLDKPYVDMGVDSILAIQISELIKLKTHFNVEPSDLYNFYSINQLHNHIQKNLATPEQSRQSNSESLTKDNPNTDDKIAIVGMSIRTADASNYNEFWENIFNRKNSVRESNRWFLETKKNYTGGFLEDIKNFDASFFKISPKEALYIDPQQRLLLEESWHAFEDAGMDLNTLNSSKCGVFVTSLPGDYKYRFNNKNDAYNTFSFQGNSVAVSAGRISHFYNLKGPAITIDTACSSSLVSLDLAIKYLDNGSCDIALVAAASIFSTPELFEFSQSSNILSRSGNCYSFDERADGFVPSEAVACLVLRKLENARKDNQRIYAVLEGSQVNHDGTTNGLMSPNSASQQQLIYSLYQRKNIDINQIAYIEAHGTGTSIGDPIEIKALTEAFSKFNNNYETYIGTSKANIGHCLVASGLAGIIKVVMCLQNNCIPGLVNFQSLNHQIKLGKFKINQKNEPWPLHKPLAAISAFGFSGTNAHLILRRFEMPIQVSDENISHLFIFSTETEEGLLKLLKSYLIFLMNTQNINIGNVSYTLNTKRQFFKKKCIIIAASKEELILNIEKFLNDRSFDNKIDVLQPFKTKKDLITWLSDAENIKNPLRKDVLLYLKNFLLKETDIPSLKSIYNESYQHISLPGYCFSQNHYWIGDTISNINLLQTTETKSKILNVEFPIQSSNKNNLIQHIKESLSEILGYKLEDISTSKAFNEYGIDSLVALQMLEKLGVNSKNMQPSLVFECQNIEKLAEYLTRDENRKYKSEDNNEKSSTQHLKYFDSIQNQVKIVEIDSSKIEWIIFGTINKPLVLLPPLNMLAHAWIQQIKYFIDQSYQIYIPHYPGHGQSVFEEKNLHEIATQLIKSYEKITLSDLPFSLAGWSLGGCLSLIISYLYPSKILKMLLINSAADFSHDLYAESISLRKELLDKVEYLTMLYDNKDVNIINTVSANCSLEVLKHYYVELQKFNMRNSLGSITTKTQIIYGAKDSVIKKEDAIKLNNIPNSEIKCFESDGHFIPLTSSFLFNKTMKQFILS